MSQRLNEAKSHNLTKPFSLLQSWGKMLGKVLYTTVLMRSRVNYQCTPSATNVHGGVRIMDLLNQHCRGRLPTEFLEHKCYFSCALKILGSRVEGMVSLNFGVRIQRYKSDIVPTSDFHR